MNKKTKKEETKKKKTYLGIIFIGMGSSWCLGENIGKVAVDCAKFCKMDWKHLFKIKKNHVHPVNIYDITDTSGGWYAGTDGVVRDKETNKEIPHLKVVYAV